jgi:hypothetical protein
MLLYHGTTENVARKALVDGLKPRADTGAKSNWTHTIDSHMDHVYMTTVYAPFFAFSAAEDKERWGIIEIESDLIDDGIYPDEDFLEQALKEVPKSVKKNDMIGRTKWFKKNINRYKHIWNYSVNLLGTCSHKGTIPASAITRVAVLNPCNIFRMMSVDPQISLMNYNICKGKYEALTKWMIGDKVSVEDMLSYNAAFASDQQKEVWQEAINDRSEWEKIK